MSSKINHDGIVDKIEVDTVKVRILQTSACAACGLAKHCSSSESKEKIIDVHTDVQGYEVGQHVVVSVSASMGYKAVLLGFGLPFLLLVAVTISRATNLFPLSWAWESSCLTIFCYISIEIG